MMIWQTLKPFVVSTEATSQGMVDDSNGLVKKSIFDDSATFTALLLSLFVMWYCGSDKLSQYGQPNYKKCRHIVQTCSLSA